MRTVHFLDSWRHFEVSCLIWCFTVVSVFASHCSLCNSSCKVGLGSSWKFFWRLWPGYRRALEEVAWSDSYKIQCYTWVLTINREIFVWWFKSNIINHVKYSLLLPVFPMMNKYFIFIHSTNSKYNVNNHKHIFILLFYSQFPHHSQSGEKILKFLLYSTDVFFFRSQENVGESFNEWKFLEINFLIIKRFLTTLNTQIFQ